jgi:hypothetical protein
METRSGVALGKQGLDDFAQRQMRGERAKIDASDPH